MTASDNLDINYPGEVKLELFPQVYVGIELLSGEEYVLSDLGLLVIKDNDGECYCISLGLSSLLFD